jgi:SPX domain protein involved in polyphosphate accumulation
MDDNTPRTIEQIRRTIKAARDSVWVIENTLDQLSKGKTPTNKRKSDIDRNVEHLKIIVADQEIIDFGESIVDLQAAIVAGEAKLAENIWLAQVVTE